MKKRPRRYNARISFVVPYEVKELLKKYCDAIEFDSEGACMRYILKKYFEFIASRKALSKEKK
jgi:hypothetical protein